MEDNNINKNTLDNSMNSIPLDETKVNPIKDDILEDSKESEESSNIKDTTIEENNITNDDTYIKDSQLVEWYQFYKSKNTSTEQISCVNKKTVTIFIILITLCIVTFISCIVIDLKNPVYNDNILAIGDEIEDTPNEETFNNNYDFSTNQGVDIEQYNPPTRADSTYINEDGTYTVAGVAEYAGDSIIAIYVSTDGITLNGMGSGIVFSDEGYVLTNAHVIQDANYIIGILPDETEVNLSFVGMDTELDIAVLQSNNKDIPVATMGNSDSVILGENVVAIGNPAGLTGTVTNGIVSSINRAYKTSDDVERNYIQTNAAISPGNSGGALLNMYGQVIGITTMKISEDDTYEGLGFAICINDALECADRLISNRFKIGITFNLKNNEIEISNIDSSCDISNTELKEGDVITEIDGIAINDYSSVMSSLEGSKPGDEVTAKVERRSSNGLKNEFYITFRLMPYNN